jgi:hypothetical protein
MTTTIASTPKTNESTKKGHWFTEYQQNLIQEIKIRDKTEKKELKQEKRALKLLQRLPDDIVRYCFEFLDEKVKIENNLTKIRYLYQKYVGDMDRLSSSNYEAYPIYKLLRRLPRYVLVKFIKSGSPAKYYNKIFNNTLFNNYKVNQSLYKTLVERYDGYKNLTVGVCAWEITKLIRFSIKEILIDGEELRERDCKKFKEYDLYFKKYEKYSERLINSILYLHNKYN